ncbi:hypothetical protein JCM11491_000042 [Sporobolomyces phaffii]
MNRLKQALSSAPSTSVPDAADARDGDNGRALARETLDSINSRRDTLTALHATFASYHKTLSKARPDPRKGDGFTLGVGGKGESRLPIHWFGVALSERAEALRDESDEAYCASLSIVGETCSSISQLSETLCADLCTRYLEDHLERGLDELKTFERLEKETDKKRSALDSYVAKGEKGTNKKLTRQDYEHEVDQLEWGYEEARRRLQTQADDIASAREQDVEALKDLITVQLDFAREYTKLLELAQSGLESLPSLSRHANGRPSSATAASTSRPKPRQSRSYSPSSAPSRSRSSTTVQPPAPSPASTLTSTRMNRSFSESSSTNTGGFSPSNLLSSLGPGRSRRSTVSNSVALEASEGKNGGAGEGKGNRSRSGSVLERFALTGGGKKKDKESSATGVDSGADKDDAAVATDSRSRSNSGGGASRWGSPSLPSMPSFKKLGGGGSGSPSTKKYGTLRDQDDGGFQDDDDEAPSLPLSSLNLDYTTTSSSPSATATRRLPPPLKRTQTAPAFSSSSPSSRSPASPLRTQFFSATAASPVGRVYEAKWSYTPAGDPDDSQKELTFEKGDLIVVKREINSDWWIGTITTRAMPRGRNRQDERDEGMFPSAYVVPHEASRDEDRYGDRSDEDDDEDGRHSLRSSNRTTLSTDSDSEEDEGEYAGRANGARPQSAAPTPLASRSSTPGRKQPPPPPPPRRTTSYSNGNAEGSPFD